MLLPDVPFRGWVVDGVRLGEGRTFHLLWRISYSLGAEDSASLGRFLFRGVSSVSLDPGFIGMALVSWSFCGGIQSLEERIHVSRESPFLEGSLRGIQLLGGDLHSWVYLFPQIPGLLREVLMGAQLHIAWASLFPWGAFHRRTPFLKGVKYPGEHPHYIGGAINWRRGFKFPGHLFSLQSAVKFFGDSFHSMSPISWGGSIFPNDFPYGMGCVSASLARVLGSLKVSMQAIP